MLQTIPTATTTNYSSEMAYATSLPTESLYSSQRLNALRYKEYNQIIKSYEVMSQQALSKGNTKSALSCQTIVEDLKLLLKLGILGKFPHKPDEKKK